MCVKGVSVKRYSAAHNMNQAAITHCLIMDFCLHIFPSQSPVSHAAAANRSGVVEILCSVGV